MCKCQGLLSPQTSTGLGIRIKNMEEETIILQSESHNDDLGIVFIKYPNGEIWCAIDWQGGEMKFKLNFIN